MQIYLVGGAVRDALLGLPVQDRDWVVVGSTPEELAEMGFAPVGKDFPVFLHPQMHEEFALARTERKTARGYRGFAIHAEPDVTLEQDLARRDLTINSIAAHARFDCAKGQFASNIEADFTALTDPFGGRADLQAKVLRHVTDAFREDPVRILRVARFAARFADFSVAPETLAVMQQMVASGEADALVAERVWQELARGLMERTPSRMVAVLQDTGAWRVLLPELAPHATGADDALDCAAAAAAPLAVRFACLCLGAATTEAVAALCTRWRVPTDCRELAEVVWRERRSVDAAAQIDAAAAVQLLERCDAFRRPARFAEVLLACQCASAAAGNYAPANRLNQALAAAQTVLTEQVAAHAQSGGASGRQIGEAIAAARVAAVAQALANQVGH
jgi:tRNA nucleotidyltransferase (CCA-adding enzyme)